MIATQILPPPFERWDLIPIEKFGMDIMFIDDTNIWEFGEEVDQISKLRRSLFRIRDWSNDKKIDFNPNKFCHLVFGNSKLSQKDIVLNFGPVKIPRKKNHKILGIYFSDDLSFDFHVSKLMMRVEKLKWSLLSK